MFLLRPPGQLEKGEDQEICLQIKDTSRKAQDFDRGILITWILI